MKIGHRHGERHRKEGCVLFIPIKWTHCAVAQWKNNNNKMKMKMAWFRQTSRLKKMVLSIAIGLKLSPNSLLRILLWLWLLFKWSLGVCSIRGSLLCTTTVVHDNAWQLTVLLEFKQMTALLEYLNLISIKCNCSSNENNIAHVFDMEQ